MLQISKLKTLFAVSMVCAVLAGCGGGDAEAPPPPVGPAPPSSAPDTTAPTVTIANDVSSPTASGPVTFTFVFSEDVGVSFDGTDIEVSGGTPSNFARLAGGTQATLVVTPPANASGTITVSVAAGSFSDLAGNLNTAAPAAVQLPYATVAKTQMALPVNFDSPTVDYGFIGFGGAEDSSVVVDPTDATNKVARVVRAAGAETFAGTTITAAAGLGFSPKIPFNANDTRMSVRVWSPDANIPVRLKVEDHTDPNKSVEAEVTVTTAAGWQTLTFNFAPGSQVGGTAAINFAFNYDKATIFFDFGRAKASSVAKTYYFDDVTFVPGAGGGGGGATKTQMALPVSFDSTTVDYGFIGFGGAEDSSVVVDPTDATNKVARVVRAAGAETFAGTTITGAAGLGFSPKIPFTATDTRMSVRVWSPDANIPVRLKVEDHTDPTRSVETEATVTTAAGWQTLTFNFADGSQASGTAAINLAFNYDKATIFFDFGRAKASAVQKTYYFDDVAFVPGAGGGGGGVATAPTVAAATPPARAVGDVLSIFSDAYTPIAGIDLNPNWGQSTVPTTELIAGNATRKYANLNYQGIDFSGNPIDVSSMTRLHIDVWTANVTSVLVSIISAGQENAVTLMPTLAGWNSFDIDLAQYTVPNKAAIIQIKIEGTPGGGTLYFDNLYFWKPAAGGGGGGGSGAALISFDEATAPKLTDFGTNGVGASIVTDPAGGTNKVMLVNKYLTPTQSEQWAGTTVSTGANDSIPALPFTASAKTMTLRVYSPAVGVRVRLKVEDASNPGVSVETDAITTTSGAWEVLTFNFANPGLSPPVGGGATSPLDLSKTYNKLSVFMDFGIGNGGSANLPGNRVYYVDDITFVSGA